MPSDREQRLYSGTPPPLHSLHNPYYLALNVVAMAATVGYLAIEYVWPAIKSRLFSRSTIQKKLRLPEPISLTSYEEEVALAGAVHPSDISASFEDIGGHDKLVGELMGNLSTMLRAPVDEDEDPRVAQLVQSKLYQPPSGILLYGPPGCGKTLIAKALAAESGARFINVPLSLLLDKWVGETEKYVEALFSLARKIQPTIIFIDEIDSLTRRRSELDASWNSTMKSQFLGLWDGLLTDRRNRVVLLGATNRRQDIDEAFLRRMPLQMRVELPNAMQRASILQVLLSDVEIEDGLSWLRLANRMDGFSGSDMREVCRRVVMDASFSAEPGPLTEDHFEQAVERFRFEQRTHPYDLD